MGAIANEVAYQVGERVLTLSMPGARLGMRFAVWVIRERGARTIAAQAVAEHRSLARTS